jgi:hypothetical protein
MTELTDIEERLIRTFGEVTSCVPESPPIALKDLQMSPARRTGPAKTSSLRLTPRWRVAAITGLAIGLAGTGTGVAAATGALSGPSNPVPTAPRQSQPPPQQDTTGTPIPPDQVLGHTLTQYPGSTRSAIRTMPYGTAEQAVSSAGLGGTGNIDPAWTPVAPSNPIDVVAISGSVRPLGATQVYSWVVEFINPVTGAPIAQYASNAGSWPSFFDSLPDEG